MSGPARKASQTIAADKVAALRRWISTTPLTKIPLNSRGLSSKQAICKALGIVRSTIGTNGEIRELFDELDKKLVNGEERPQAPKHSTQSFEDTPTIIAQIGALLKEIDELKMVVKRFEHLDNTGQLIR